MSHHVALVRTNVSGGHQFLQEPDGITSQKMTFLIMWCVLVKSIDKLFDSKCSSITDVSSAYIIVPLCVI
jgi:hypothetical protein